MDTSRSILQSAKRFFAGTFLSRISGLLREIAMAFAFGTSPAVAAFMVAYRLANLFRRLLGEGNLQSGFAPHFESLYAQNPKAALQFYRDVSFSLLALLLVITVGMEGGLALGASYFNESWQEVARLAMWMAPGLIFICLYGLNAALLQCKKQYFLTGVAPVAFNFVWIAFACFARNMEMLSMGITLGFCLQWLLTSLQVRKEIFAHLTLQEWLSPQIFSTSWKRLMKSLSLGILGVGAMQINSACDAIFARFADLSGPTYLWYAIRVYQLPLALFGIALSGALLPPLARAMQSGSKERYMELLRGSLRQSAALMVPCTFALFVLGESGLKLLYQHGQFSEESLPQTLHCLWGYGLGLVPAVFVLLLANGFYARKSYAIPVIASVSAVAVNLFLNALFVFVLHWGAVSIAIATSVSSFCNVGILSYCLSKELGAIHCWGLLGKLVVCSALIGIVVTQIGGGFFLQAPLYLAGVLGLARWMKVAELQELLRNGL
ncbi:MAG: murein biosynthesis integral membrane protein MurJ [Chlamydiia bacterium]|nr:murein biosynthesis integral membrane protein MurJ [Chlamydiia bacterium]